MEEATAEPTAGGKEDAVASSSKNEGEIETEEQTKFSETAMGLGLANGMKAVLTPVVGLGLMGAAAHDAVASGATGTYYKAGDLIGKTEKGSIDIKATKVGEAEFRQSILPSSTGRVEPTPVDVFDPDTADFSSLKKDYVDKGIPFILRREGGKPISDASPPETDDGSGAEGHISVMSDSIKAKFPGIDEIIKKVLPKTYRAYWPLWFQGNYKSGLAHVDLGPGTCNFYFMKQGKKDVVIAPFETTRDLVLKSGIDNLYVPGSSGNHEYLSILDKYYRVLVEEQSILVFNNSGCLHHFTNVVEDNDVLPIALSVRCKHAYGSDPRGWLNLAANVKVWWNMTDHMLALRKEGPDRRKEDMA